MIFWNFTFQTDLVSTLTFNKYMRLLLAELTAVHYVNRASNFKCCLLRQSSSIFVFSF